MKVRCDILLDLDTGDFSVSFHNLTAPGEPMDYGRIRTALRRAVDNVDEQRPGQTARPASVAQKRPGSPRR